VRREASLVLDFTMWCTSCSAAEVLVNANRSSRQMAGGPSGKKQGQAGVAGINNGARSSCRASCNLPFLSLSPVTCDLWLPQRSQPSVIRPFKPQDPRPTSLEKLPTEFAP
jgi:hypothetical protein